MGVDTYTLDSCIAYKPGTNDARLDALRYLAVCLGLCDLHNDAGDFDEAMRLFGMAERFSLEDSRPPYFDRHTLAMLPGSDEVAEGAYREGGAPEIVGQCLARYIVPGSWVIYESDGEPWALFWDGERMHSTEARPVVPPGLAVNYLLSDEAWQDFQHAEEAPPEEWRGAAAMYRRSVPSVIVPSPEV